MNNNNNNKNKFYCVLDKHNNLYWSYNKLDAVYWHIRYDHKNPARFLELDRLLHDVNKLVNIERWENS
jgi:hypothetical protein